MIPFQTITLANGLRVLIRPIRPDDKAELQRGMGRLSQETLYRRFLAAKPRLTSSELRYFTEVDNHDHIALVAVELHFPHRIMGVARAVRDLHEPDLAEWAIVIADPLQGMGLGSRMIEMLADAAKGVGIRRFTATMLTDNEPVHRLLARITDRLERDERHGATHEVVVGLAA
jgi:RimJ/RimL family protein N-acetyltransferase